MSALLFMAALGLASGPVHAVVDRSQASVEDAITLTVLIDDARAREPELPRVPGARVVRRGRVQSSQIINGERTDTVAYRYAVFPRRTGTLRIPAIAVRVGGQLHQTEALSVEVVGAENPGGLAPFFAVAEVDETRPYRSQQIIYTLQLYGELLNISCNQIEWPNFDRFIVENVGQERRFETVRGGRRFRVLELRKALYPLEPGTIKIPAAELTCTVTYPSTGSRGFGRLFTQPRTETKLLRTKPLTLEVRPLPPAPPDFSNIVGRVQINARSSERRLMAGSSATQTLYVRSDGNLRGFVPKKPTLDGVKIYDDQAKVEINDRGSRLESTLQMNRAFVPVREGRLTIPAISFSYFDPDSGRYERASTRDVTLEVTANPDAESLRLVDGTAPAADQREVEVAEDTLMPYAATPALGVRPPPEWAVVLATLLPVAFFVVSSFRGRLRGPTRHAPLRRVLEPLADEADAETIERVVREVLTRGGDEFRAVTAAEVATRLDARGVPEPDRQACAAWLRWAETARYGGGMSETPSSREQLGALLTRLDSRLEKPT